MKNAKVRLIALASAAALALSISACASPSGNDSGNGTGAEQPLRVAYPQDVSSLDPIRGNAGTDHAILWTMYDTLINWDPQTLEPTPGLAESWDLSDPNVLALTLRQGVTFQDGTPFDAEAVKYNLERAASEESNIKTDVASIASVEVVDANRVNINLTAPNSALLLILTDRAGMMVSPTAAEQNAGDLSLNPVGAGGWSFVEWRRGASVTVERYEDYWDASAVRAPQIVFSVITDPTTRVTALNSGQQDFVVDVPPSNAQALESSNSAKLVQSSRVLIAQIYLNDAKPEISDVRVRQALSLAVNREEILKTGYFGYGSVANEWMPADHWANAGEKYEYDPEKAKQLLAEAGVSNLSFTLALTQDPNWIRVGEILKAQWAEIGVTIDISPVENTQGSTDHFADGKTVAWMANWTGRPDPSQTFLSLFGKEGYFNAGRVDFPGLQAAVDAANAATEQDDRAAAFKEAAAVVYDQVPAIPLVFADLLVGMSNKVEGYQPNLLGKPKFIGITVG